MQVMAGDIIPNTAAIYFDLNPAIITNTFETRFVNTLGMDTQSSIAFTIYPNPANTLVTISLWDNWNDSISEIVIYDLVGKIIKIIKPAISARNEMVDISDIAVGIYLIEVTAGIAKTTKKLIIK